MWKITKKQKNNKKTQTIISEEKYFFRCTTWLISSFLYVFRRDTSKYVYHFTVLIREHVEKHKKIKCVKNNKKTKKQQKNTNNNFWRKVFFPMHYVCIFLLFFCFFVIFHTFYFFVFFDMFPNEHGKMVYIFWCISTKYIQKTTY